MKTLIYEPDASRARGHAALLAEDASDIEVARSLAQARLMLLNDRYDRLALRRGAGAARALLGAARASNPDCVMVDLGSMRARPVSGPAVAAVPATEAR
ncbi:hypothetical protein N8I71_08455 [Roseibacterium sp. SDUM158016]|uniref:hypothetical protein n=1 Tax=Roseicyclus sediminis TaxID=2980997 RepID=UPI0021D13279|nr:hypothetical protein [Roseibacterium sp. SDUM158016]MCU4652860.1 hypothetical protein [Roseibacterium sp. SDUM158016]